MEFAIYCYQDALNEPNRMRDRLPALPPGSNPRHNRKIHLDISPTSNNFFLLLAGAIQKGGCLQRLISFFLREVVWDWETRAGSGVV